MGKSFRDWNVEQGWLLPPSVMDFVADRFDISAEPIWSSPVSLRRGFTWQVSMQRDVRTAMDSAVSVGGREIAGRMVGTRAQGRPTAMGVQAASCLYAYSRFTRYANWRWR